MSTATEKELYPVTKQLREWLFERKLIADADPKVVHDSVCRKATGRALMDDSLSEETFVALCGAETESEEDMSTEATTKDTKADKIFGKPASIRVKPAGEQYSDKRWSAKHAKTGQTVHDEWGAEVTKPSQKSLALSGAFLKHAARRSGMSVEWSPHDQNLLDEVVNDCEWAAHDGPPDQCKIYSPGTVKAALLDDANSGGLEAAPITFDADFITTALLTGELLPTVDLKPISRGRRVESGSVNTPTAAWGEGDSSIGTVYDSTGQIAALDTSIHDLSAHVLIGRNFMSDSPLAIGTMLVGLIGERMQNELERAISVGSGSMPSGIMGTAGTTAVNFSSAAITIAKVLSLLFSVPKELRGPGFAFGSNEVTYRRLRSLATGVSGDERLLFNMDVESYRVLDRPWKICHHMANTQVFGGDMKAYRLYRRLGSSVEFTQQGENLQRRNQVLLTVRQRWGGRVFRAASFGVVTDAEA